MQFKAPPAPRPFTWTGCYAGAQAGGGWGQKDVTDTAGIVAPITGFTAVNLGVSGYMLGGQIGCDYQFTSNWTLGVEGAATGGNIGGSTAVAVPGDNATFKQTTDFLSSATARVGYAWDHWLLYAKGGAAWAGATDTARSTSFRRMISKDWRFIRLDRGRRHRVGILG